jgi:hypothetical protein
MTYPILKANNASFVARELETAMSGNGEVLKFEFAGLDKYVEYRAGANLEGAALEKILSDARELSRQWAEYRKVDRANKTPISNSEMEQAFAELLFLGLRDLPAVVLQDSDFWRYLTLFPYRWYVWNREGDFRPTRFGGDGEAQKNRWTLIRAYLWAAKTWDEEHGDLYLAGIRNARLEAGLGDGWVIDFYSNNVVRNRMSAQPKVAQAFVAAIVSEVPVFDTSNEFRPTDDVAQRVRRLSANVFYPSLTRDELTVMFEEEKKVIQGLVTE